MIVDLLYVFMCDKCKLAYACFFNGKTWVNEGGGHRLEPGGPKTKCPKCADGFVQVSLWDKNNYLVLRR